MIGPRHRTEWERELLDLEGYSGWRGNVRGGEDLLGQDCPQRAHGAIIGLLTLKGLAPDAHVHRCFCRRELANHPRNPVVFKYEVRARAGTLTDRWQQLPIAIPR